MTETVDNIVLYNGDKNEYSIGLTSGEIATVGMTQIVKDILYRLSEYENTQLEPCEIKQLQAENASLRARLDKAVELPCKQFETVFYIINNEIKVGWYIARVGESTNIVITDKIELGLCWVTDNKLFFDYNEAQAKLDEVKGGVDIEKSNNK